MMVPTVEERDDKAVESLTVVTKYDFAKYLTS